MARARTSLRTVGLLGASALIAAGCGGGETPPATGAAPVPTPTPIGTDPLVSDPGAGGTAPGTPVIDPLTGQPVESASASGITATIPSLVGDDIGGGISATSSDPIFTAGAIDPVDADEMADQAAQAENQQPANASTPSNPSGPAGSAGSAEPAEAAVKYSGAKIFVDGIVHEVSTNGVFPKGSPVFRLLNVSGDTIEIELVAGEFTSGGGIGTLLDKGELVSLVNGSEQLTYRVKFLRPVTDSTGISF